MNEQSRDITRRMVTVVSTTALSAALLFGGAGTIHYPRGWLFVGLSLVMLLGNAVYVLRVNPEAIAARARVRPGTKPFDRVFMVVFGTGLLALPVVAGVDGGRFGPPAFGPIGVAVGVGLMLVGNGFIAWSMGANRHLEQTVRIQEDRGHTVVTTGPYALVRHPMYTGALAQYAGTPLVLGAPWAYAVVAVLALSLVVRTALEDRTLRAELDGYEAYAEHTRYRLLPGVW